MSKKIIAVFTAAAMLFTSLSADIYAENANNAAVDISGYSEAFDGGLKGDFTVTRDKIFSSFNVWELEGTLTVPKGVTLTLIKPSIHAVWRGEKSYGTLKVEGELIIDARGGSAEISTNFTGNGRISVKMSDGLTAAVKQNGLTASRLYADGAAGKIRFDVNNSPDDVCNVAAYKTQDGQYLYTGLSEASYTFPAGAGGEYTFTAVDEQEYALWRLPQMGELRIGGVDVLTPERISMGVKKGQQSSNMDVFGDGTVIVHAVGWAYSQQSIMVVLNDALIDAGSDGNALYFKGKGDYQSIVIFGRREGEPSVLNGNVYVDGNMELSTVLVNGGVYAHRAFINHAVVRQT